MFKKVFLCIFTVALLSVAVLACAKTNEATKTEAAVAESETADKPAKTIKINLVVDGSEAEKKAVYFEADLEVAEGTTCYEALKNYCDESKIKISGKPDYVTGISTLNEKDCGPNSGWMYLINDEIVWEAADKQTLSDGDILTWKYVK